MGAQDKVSYNPIISDSCFSDSFNSLKTFATYFTSVSYAALRFSFRLQGAVSGFGIPKSQIPRTDFFFFSFREPPSDSLWPKCNFCYCLSWEYININNLLILSQMSNSHQFTYLYRFGCYTSFDALREY